MRIETDIFDMPAPMTAFTKIWQGEFRRSIAGVQKKTQGQADRLRKAAAGNTPEQREYLEAANYLQALANTLGSVVEAVSQ